MGGEDNRGGRLEEEDRRQSRVEKNSRRGGEKVCRQHLTPDKGKKRKREGKHVIKSITNNRYP